MKKIERNFKVADNIVISKINNESVVLNINTGIYFQTNELGSFIISQLDEYIDFSTLQERVLQNFDVSVEECQRDLLQFIDKLKEKNILQFQ